MTRTIGILPLGRATFDVAFAEDMLAGMVAALDATGHRIVGPRHLLLDAEATRDAMAALAGEAVTDLLVLQVTFTDAEMVAEAASAFDQPLSIWAAPEPRLGGRLRLNAFCGLNLAAHALGLRGRAFSWLYVAPDDAAIAETLAALLEGKRVATPVPTQPSAPLASPEGAELVDDLRGRRVGLVGTHPPGFDTCRYNAAWLARVVGIEVTEIALDTLFDKARALPDARAAAARADAERVLEGLESVDAAELDRSLRLKGALETLKTGERLDAFAVRCWPETFTQYGGAVCGPVSMLGETRVPCACEADVYGAVTSLALQAVADQPVFLVDLVDIDVADGTGVVWHCGQAPVSMASPRTAPRATIHTNRKMPLLFEFALKPGRVTFARLSQALGETKLVIAGGEMLDAPMAFTGTSGTVRFDTPAEQVLNGILGSGLEHHMAVAYGDHRRRLGAVAAALGVDILEF